MAQAISKSNFTKNLQSIDWSFSSLNNKGLHSLHWYPATFLGAIPGTLIPALSKPMDVVLDPFNGSCTTGIESIRLGRKFIGIDSNPIAILIGKAKLYYPSPKSFSVELDRILEESSPLRSVGSVDEHPQRDELLGWYNLETFNELNRILHSILEIKSKKLRECFLAVFSGILKSTSSQGRHWGWVCDNVKPKPNEIVYKDATTAFLSAAKEFIKASALAQSDIKMRVAGELRAKSRSRAKFYHGDCLTVMEGMAPSSVDLVLTSPPYYGVVDYIKSQRLSFLWFDRDEFSADQLGFREFQRLRKIEAGSRAFRHRSSSFSEYMDFMQHFFQSCHRVLKPGAHFAMVIGESKARNSTTDLLVESATKSGFTLEMRKKRDIKETRRRIMKQVEDEDVLIFQRE